MSADSATCLSNGSLPGSSRSAPLQLRRTLGLFNGVSLIMGVIIGSGIFVSPAFVLQGVGSVGAALVVWLAGGVLCLLGALCFAELGTLVSLPGGVYAYIQAAFGDFAGFQFLWLSLIVIFPAGNAVIALACASYILQPFRPCHDGDAVVRIIAFLVIALLTYVNCVSVRVSTHIQNVLTVMKTLALSGVILTGLVSICRGTANLGTFSNMFEGTSTSMKELSFSFYSGLFSYSGWYALNFLTEEMKNPYQNLPRAIWISLPLTTLIYVLSNISYFVVLGKEGVLKSDAVAFTLAEHEFGMLSWMMPVFVASSCFCSLNGFLLSVSRLFYIGAQNGHLPQFLSLVSLDKMTPLPAVVFEGTLSAAMLLADDISVLINCAMFVELAVLMVCTVAFLKFRWMLRGIPRPMKVHISLPIIFLVLSGLFVFIPMVTSPRDISISLIIMAAGLPVYAIGVLWRRKPNGYHNTMDAISAVIQKCIMGLPAKSEDGPAAL